MELLDLIDKNKLNQLSKLNYDFIINYSIQLEKLIDINTDFKLFLFDILKISGLDINTIDIILDNDIKYIKSSLSNKKILNNKYNITIGDSSITKILIQWLKNIYNIPEDITNSKKNIISNKLLLYKVHENTNIIDHIILVEGIIDINADSKINNFKDAFYSFIGSIEYIINKYKINNSYPYIYNIIVYYLNMIDTTNLTKNDSITELKLLFDSKNWGQVNYKLINPNDPNIISNVYKLSILFNDRIIGYKEYNDITESKQSKQNVASQALSFFDYLAQLANNNDINELHKFVKQTNRGYQFLNKYLKTDNELLVYFKNINIYTKSKQSKFNIDEKIVLDKNKIILLKSIYSKYIDIDLFKNKKYYKLFYSLFRSYLVDPINNYEYYEIIGDVSANKCVLEYLLNKYDINKTNIQNIKLSYISTTNYAMLSDKLDLYKYFDHKDVTQHLNTAKIKEDLFEAFIGITELILDSEYGIGQGYKYICKIITDILDNTTLKTLSDAVTILKEILQKINYKADYKLIKITVAFIIIDQNNQSKQLSQIVSDTMKNAKKQLTDNILLGQGIQNIDIQNKEQYLKQKNNWKEIIFKPLKLEYKVYKVNINDINDQTYLGYGWGKSKGLASINAAKNALNNLNIINNTHQTSLYNVWTDNDKFVKEQFINTVFPIGLYNKQSINKLVNYIDNLIINVKNDDALYDNIREYVHKTLYKDPIYLKIKYTKSQTTRINKRIIDIDKLLIGINKNFKSYLDVGCSEGSITAELGHFLQLTKDKIHGCDIVLPGETNIILNINEKQDFNFTLLQQQNVLPYQNNSQSLVTALMSLHHMQNVNDMLYEIFRVLDDNGIFIIREHDSLGFEFQQIVDLMHAFYMLIWPDKKESKNFNDFYAKYLSIDKWRNLILNISNDTHYFKLINHQQPQGPWRYYYDVYIKIKKNQ